MSNQLRTFELFGEANPVPDPMTIDALDVEPATYLATLQERSSEMTQLIDRPRERAAKKPRRLIVAAAVAAVLVIVGVLAVLQRDQPVAPPVATEPTTPVEVGPAGFWVVDEVRELALLNDGTYFWMTVGSVTDDGTWTVEEEELVLTSGRTSLACVTGAVGRFGFDLGEGTLVLTFRSDECGGERDVAPIAGADRTRTFTESEPFERP